MVFTRSIVCDGGLPSGIPDVRGRSESGPVLDGLPAEEPEVFQGRPSPALNCAPHDLTGLRIGGEKATGSGQISRASYGGRHTASRTDGTGAAQAIHSHLTGTFNNGPTRRHQGTRRHCPLSQLAMCLRARPRATVEQIAKLPRGYGKRQPGDLLRSTAGSGIRSTQVILQHELNSGHDGDAPTQARAVKNEWSGMGGALQMTDRGRCAPS